MQCMGELHMKPKLIGLIPRRIVMNEPIFSDQNLSRHSQIVVDERISSSVVRPPWVLTFCYFWAQICDF